MKKTLQTEAPIRHLSMQGEQRRAIAYVEDVQSNYLDVTPEYQRPPTWSIDQRRLLVKSWLMGLPVPAVIINVRRDWPGITVNDPWTALVDGKQRVETALAWFEGDLAVPASWFEPGDVEQTEETEDGSYVRFAGLALRAQRLVQNRAMLPTIEVRVGSVEEEAEMFLLVNTGGTAQSEEDLDRARQVAAR
ncbi:DUF262 domain-containing protein [Agromyces humi]|uniref:DUF262 domain-containing protein n=1 Tax=Agromyces humi TaxID=1766800 RepID=UPI00135AC226|nr:DUF262 domain-containing protein [Agromyces humi]